MGRFHFESANAETVSAELIRLRNVVAVSNKNIREVKNCLTASKGFGIEEVREQIERQFAAGAVICDRLDSGCVVINDIKAIIEKYDTLVFSTVFIDEIAYIKNNTSSNGSFDNVFRQYFCDTSEIMNKYINGATVISQIKAAFMETIKNSSYEKYLIKKSIKNIINTTSNDIVIKKPLKKYMDQRGDIETILSLFNDDYPKNPIGKAYKELKFDIDILNTLINDYTNNMEYLNSLESALSQSGFDKGVLHVVMDEIRDDYNNKYAAALNDTFKYGLQTIATEAFKLNPIGKTVLTVLDITELADNTGDSKMDYAAIITYEQEALNSYGQLANKINSGNYTEQELVDFNNMFEICRNIEIIKYETASDFVLGDDYKNSQEAINFYKNLKM